MIRLYTSFTSGGIFGESYMTLSHLITKLLTMWLQGVLILQYSAVWPSRIDACSQWNVMLWKCRCICCVSKHVLFLLQCQVSYCSYQCNWSWLPSESGDEVFTEEWIIWRIVHPSSGKNELKRIVIFCLGIAVFTFVLFCRLLSDSPIRKQNKKSSLLLSQSQAKCLSLIWWVPPFIAFNLSLIFTNSFRGSVTIIMQLITWGKLSWLHNEILLRSNIEMYGEQ